ncbi:MFS transporter [Kutzneria viridogrisea]|uniref:Inner membrane transport protein ynfM n=2 Tax=Kutzneria TaxID=43356 RepID=W5W1Z5_9PSEU|nr:MFS transporter [Kutzneria albida]AHH94815.1 Inner membrane transport protein ynfM [Kutzneria albida DSM 43870]MBA8930484.1 YNFM family putative membrane transporter [Kutzneria viridogrisea]
MTTSDQAHRRGSPEFRRIALALFAAGLATFMVLYCTQPLLPLFAQDYRLTPAEASLAVSVCTGTLALAILPLSSLSEAWGRIPVMTASLFCSAALQLVVALSPSFPVLLVARGLQGIALAGLPAVAMAYLSEEVHRGSLGFAMGLYVGGNSIGGMGGRVITGLVTDVAGWRWALATVGLVSLGCAVLFRLAVPASGNFRRAPLRLGALARGVAGSVADSGLRRLYTIGFLLMACFVTIYNFLGFRLLGAPFWLSQAVVGLISVAYLAGTASSPAAGRLVDRFGRRKVFWLTTVVMLAGLGLLLSDNLVLLVIGLLVLTAGFFAAHTVASGWVGARAQANRAQASAAYLLCYYLGSSVGGSVGGLAFSGGGWLAVTGFTAALTLGCLAIGFSLRSLVPAAPVTPLPVPSLSAGR